MRAAIFASLLACSSPPAPAPAPAPAHPHPPAPAPAPAAADDRDVGDVLVAVDRVDQYSRDRITMDTAALQDAARECLDELLPVPSRPARAAWVVGVSWTGTFRSEDPDAPAERSLIESQPLPRRLAQCVLDRAEPSADVADGRHEVLLAIRTRGLAASQGDTPLDDPLRAIIVNAWGKLDLVTGTSKDVDGPLKWEARRVAAKCTAETSPVRDRPLEIAWTVTLSWSNPNASGTGVGSGIGGHGGPSWGGRPHAPPPEGFEACMNAELRAPPFTDQLARIQLHVEVMTRCYRDEHMYGTLGHGSGTSAGYGSRGPRAGCRKP
jgi:hypothetical protein